MIKRHGIKLLALMLTAVIMFSFIPKVFADEGGNVLEEPVKMVLYQAEMQIFAPDDEEGSNPLDLSDPIPKDARLKLKYSFRELPGGDVDIVEGDYLIITLPSELTAITTFDPVPETPLTIKYMDDGGIEEEATIAYWALSEDGSGGYQILVTFTDQIEELGLSNIDTWVQFEGKFNENKIQGGEETSFELIAGGDQFSIKFEDDPEEPQLAKPTIKKRGEYKPEEGHIVWTIEVNEGDADNPLSKFRVVDTIGDHQSFVGAYSNSGLSDSISFTGTYEFSFDLDPVASHTFYLVTKVEAGAFGSEASSKVLVNDVDLYEKDDVEPCSTDQGKVTVTTDWVQKAGKSRKESDGYYIDWTITLNNNYRTIPDGAKVTDTLPTFLSLVDNTVELDENPVVTGASSPAHTYTYNSETREFTFIFGSDITEKTVLTFTTKVDDDYFGQQAITSFRNTATLNWDGSGYTGGFGGSGTVSDVPTSLIAKSASAYNPATQLIEWTLEVNRNKRKIDAVTVKDTLGDDQVLHIVEADDEDKTDQSIKRTDTDPETFLTRASSGDNLAVGSYYYNEEHHELTINLGDLTVDDQPKLVFQTQVINPNIMANNQTKRTVKNSATLYSDDKRVADTERTVATKSEVISKEGTDYDYDTRELSWKIVINQNMMVMPDAVVTDTIPEGQIFVAGSLEIDGSAPGEGVLTVAEDDQSFEIILGRIEKEVTITFKTKLVDPEEFFSKNDDLVLTNEATVNSGHNNAPTVEVEGKNEVENKPLEKGVRKEFSSAEGYIGWEVYINANQAPMTGAVISDTLQEGLELDTESVELYYWSLINDGSYDHVKGEDPVEQGDQPGQYNFTYDFESREFKVYLPDGAQGYYLSFNTDVLKGGDYKNTISMDGKAGIVSEAEHPWRISESDANAGGSGWNGSIRVRKTDLEGNPITSEDAVFELLDSQYIVKKTLTTDDKGEVFFNKLKLRTFYVREKRAPEGYALNEELFEFTLTNDSTETRNQSGEVRNALQTAEVSFHKINPDGKFLEGGLFGIYLPESDVPLMTASAVAGGEVRFEGLPHGSYVIREIEPPVGYMGTSVEIPVELTVDEDNVLHDLLLPDLVNEWDGAIILLKLGDEGDPLGGVTFQLLDEGKEPIGEAVLTDKDGKFEWSGLLPGTYYLREIAGLPGYESLLEDLEVVLSDDKAGEMVQEVEVENKLLRASVSLQKVDQDGEPLSGGLFGIYDPEDVRFETPLLKVEAEEGTILFEGLLPGDYIIREIEAPKDYQLTDEVIGVKLEIGKDNTLADIELEEKLVNVSSLLAGDDDDLDDDLVETGGFLDATMLWLLGILLVLMGLLFLLRLKPVKAR